MTTLKEIRLHCPVCAKEFASDAVVTTNASCGKRTDFQPRAAGTQPTAFQVHACPRCGYAGKEGAFAEGVTLDPGLGQRVWNELTPRMTGAALAASEKFEFAAKVAMWSGASPALLGDLNLRAAWCCVDEGDTEAERYFRRYAAWSFESALDEYDGMERVDRPLITYLVGELWRRIGDERRAGEWFDRVGGEITSYADQQWLVDLARRQKDDPRDWFSGELYHATSNRS